MALSTIDPKVIQSDLVKILDVIKSDLPPGSYQDALYLIETLAASPFVLSIVTNLVAAVERHMPAAL